MKEKIYTIPVNEAFDAGDECPFCFLERDTEQRTIRYVLGPGASYMEPEVRGETDKVGFCTHHIKKVYDYGNTLGGALILQTYYACLLEEFQTEAAQFTPPAKKSFFATKKKTEAEPWWQRLEHKVNSCFLCNRLNYNMERYYHTFFYMLKDAEFREKVAHSKGFCLRHFAELMKIAEDQLPNSQRDWFYGTIPALTEENLVRVKEDLDWLIAKYDYRNAGADWKNSRDALQRTMQKLQGSYPADPPYSDR
jgi:hypothetical protein